MGGEEGASDEVRTREEIHCLRREALDIGFEIRTLADSGKRSSVPRVVLQTYKRRKYARSSPDSKGQGKGRESVEAASKLEDEKNHASLGDSNGVLDKQCRTFILERIRRSLNDDGGGIQGCICEALKMEVEKTDTHDKEGEKWPLLPQSMPNGTHYAARERVVISNESLNGIHRPVTEMCQHAFRNIIHSEKFTLLCKLLFQNFQELKTDNILSLSPIHRKMRDGTYERSPWYFHADIQQLWKKLQDIGNELKSIAEGLSDISATCYNEQFYPRESYLNGKSEDLDLCCAYNVSSCQHCGYKADVRECLVCDSCEQTYHVHCIESSVNGIPQKNWYCGSCTAGGMNSPHENCIACARLNTPRTQCNQAGDTDGSPANENTCSEFEDASDCTRDIFHKASDGGSRSVCSCKICGSEVENGEKVMICEHMDCCYKYYHVRCLSNNLLKSHGPRWYCPSCLCRVCLDDKDDDKIVLCDGCDHGYHMYCTIPPLTSIPEGKWFCRHCDVKIKKIRWARRQYEKQKGKKMHGKCVEDSDKSREGMDILLTAALGHTSNSNSKF